MHNEYLDDLLNRMESNEWLPATEGEVRMSSTHSISDMAHREAEKICDPSLIADLEMSLKKRNIKNRFRNIIYILAHLCANTKSPDSIALFLKQFERKDLTHGDRAFLTLCATKCKIVHAKSFIRAYLDSDHRDVLSQSLQYFEATGDSTYLPKICELLDADCKGLCHPMYAIFALEKIGDKSAIPYLESFTSRHNKARKGDLLQSLQYAKAALATLGHVKHVWEQDTQDMFIRTVVCGNIAGAKTWIDVGADVNIADNSGWTPLCLAANCRDVEMVHFLLDQGAKLTSHNELGHSALMISSSQGSIEIVQLLCNRGANTNEHAPDGTTALIEAYKNGHNEVVHCLLQHGANKENLYIVDKLTGNS